MPKIRRSGTARGNSTRGKIDLDMAGKSWRLIVLAEGILPILSLERVDVNRSVRRLRCDVLVQRIPGYALNVVAVLGNLTNKGSCFV